MGKLKTKNSVDLLHKMQKLSSMASKGMGLVKASTLVLLGLLVFVSLVVGESETASRRHESVLGASSAELNAIGLVDVTGPDYGADPTGNQDSTQAIQAAMNDSYWAEKAVFFPPGTYKITDTLWGVQESNNMRSRAHLFIGSTKGARPVIKLVNNAAGFNNPDNPKAAVHFYAAWDDDNPDPENERAGNSFNQGIRGVDIEVGTGNSGAIGLRFNAAQDSILENVKITMNSGFAGLYNLIGTNAVISNIEVVGGKYGIYTNKQGSQWPAISNLTLRNQTDYAIYDMQTVPVIAGFKIIKNSAPVIKVKDASWAASYAGGSLSLIDGTIELSQINNEPVIDNSLGRSVVLKNVYFKNANTIINSGGTSLPGGSGWKRVDEYASTIKKNSVDDGNQIGRTLIDGTVDLENITPAAESVPEPPNNLMSTHAVAGIDYPSPDVILEAIADGTTINGLTVANVKDHGVQGAPTGADNSSRDGPDDTSSLQNVINNYDIVFLPKGKYLTTSTLVLKENTHLIGVTNYMSEIRPHEDWKPTSSSPGTVIRTVDSASAKTKMSYMKVGYGSETNYDWFTAFEWRAGRNSVYKNVMVRPVLNSTIGGNSKTDIKINGNGGGKFYGLDSHANGNRTQHPGHRRLLIENTHEPILMYGLNVEDGHGDWQAEIKNSQNIAIYGYKSEDSHDLYIYDSENFILFGHGGSIEQKIVNTNNVYEGNLAKKRWTRWGTTDELDSKKVLTETYSGQTNDFRSDRIIALFKRGQADFDVFRTDGSLPSTSSPSPTPATCRPGDTSRPCDDDVDIFDYNTLLEEFGQPPPHTADFSIPLDGDVDIFDYNILLTNFGQPGIGAYFTVSVVDESFCMYLTDPDQIQIATDVYYGNAQAGPQGLVRDTSGGFNYGYSGKSEESWREWSWHLDPAQTTMVEAAIEVCDGLPSAVETWTHDGSRTYCPWLSQITALDCSP